MSETSDLAVVVAENERLRAEVARLRGMQTAAYAGELGRRVEAEAALDRLRSWSGLMTLLDEHWPSEVFPTLTDDPGRDPGARIVSLLRWLDLARLDAVCALDQVAYRIVAELVCCGEDEPCGGEICKWGRAALSLVRERRGQVAGQAPGAVTFAPLHRLLPDDSVEGKVGPGADPLPEPDPVPEAQVWGVRKGSGVRVAKDEASARAYAADVTKGGEVVLFDRAVPAWVPAPDVEPVASSRPARRRTARTGGE